MLNCNECKSEISITSRACPKCGSKKQFKGYSFSRNQLVSMGVTSTMDFMNYTDNGGNIKGKFWLYLNGIISIIIVYATINHFMR